MRFAESSKGRCTNSCTCEGEPAHGKPAARGRLANSTPTACGEGCCRYWQLYAFSSTTPPSLTGCQWLSGRPLVGRYWTDPAHRAAECGNTRWQKPLKSHFCADEPAAGGLLNFGARPGGQTASGVKEALASLVFGRRMLHVAAEPSPTAQAIAAGSARARLFRSADISTLLPQALIDATPSPRRRAAPGRRNLGYVEAVVCPPSRLFYFHVYKASAYL